MSIIVAGAGGSNNSSSLFCYRSVDDYFGIGIRLEEDKKKFIYSYFPSR